MSHLIILNLFSQYRCLTFDLILGSPFIYHGIEMQKETKVQGESTIIYIPTNRAFPRSN